MKLKTDFILGKKSKLEWTGVYGYKPENPSEFKKLGEMYAVIRAASASSEFPIDKFAKIAVENLQQNYFEENLDETSALANLKKSCQKMKQRIDLLLSRETEAAQNGIDLEMAVVVYKDNFLYLALIGESKIFLLRDSKLIDLSKAVSKNAENEFLNTASLEIQKEDKLCIATSKSISNLEELESSLTNLNISKLDTEDLNGVSMMFIADEKLDWNQAIEEDEDVITEETTEDAINEGEETTPGLETDNEVKAADSVPIKEDLEDVQNEGVDEIPLHDSTKSLIPKEKKKYSDIIEEDITNDEANNESEYESKIANIANIVKSTITSGLKLVRTQIGQIKNKSKNTDDPEESNLKENTQANKYVKTATNKANAIKNRITDHFKNNQTTYVHFFQSTIDKILDLLGRIKFAFEKEILGKNVRRLPSETSRLKRNRWIFVISVVVLSFFIISSVRSAQSRARENEFNRVQTEKVAELTDKVEAVTSAAGAINVEAAVRNIEQIQSEAQQQITEVEAKKFKTKDRFIDDYRSILMQANNQKNRLLKLDEITGPEIIADFGAQFEDTLLTDIEYSEGSLFASDEGRNIIYKITPEISGQFQNHITNVTKPRILVRNVAGEIVVYDDDKSITIAKFDPNESDSLYRFPGLTPPEIGRVVDAAIYDGNDSLYELRQNHRQIYKRDKTGVNYQSGGAVYTADKPQNWKTSSELSDAKDIEVPFEVYALTSTGIKRYLGGEDNTITDASFQEILPTDLIAINSATAMEVTARYLAVGDSVNNRVLLFQIQEDNAKSLKFIRQFKYTGEQNIFSNIKEIKINETDGKIYVLDGARIIRLSIPNESNI